MSLVSLLPVLVICATLVVLLRFRTRQQLSCEEILRHLHPHQLRGLDRYLGDASLPDADFWRATDGMRGLWYRWQNRTIFVQLLQLKLLTLDCHDEDLNAALSAAAALTAASSQALIVGLFRYAAPSLADRLAFKAFRIYAHMADSAFLYFTDSDTPMCGRHLAALL